MVEKEDNLKDRIDNITRRNFWVTNCPEKIWREFADYSKNEANNNYSMAIRMLLTIAKTHAKDAIMYERYIELDKRIKQLDNNLIEVAKAVKVLSQLKESEEDEEIEEVIEPDKVENKVEEEVKKVNVPTMGGSKITYIEKNKEDD